MRPQVWIPLLLITIFTVTLPFVHRTNSRSDRKGAGSTVTAVNAASPSTAVAADNPPGITARASHSVASSQAPGSSDSDYEKYVSNRVTELNDIAMNGDAGSLATITSELDNRDPEIRRAAVDATVQFGSRDAIPALEQAYQHVDDPEDKVAIRKAMDFLQLPSMTEVANVSRNR